MIPEEGAKYAISYQANFDPFRSWSGVAICNGKIDGIDCPETGFKQWYGFNIEGDEDTIFFAEEDIIAAVK